MKYFIFKILIVIIPILKKFITSYPHKKLDKIMNSFIRIVLKVLYIQIVVSFFIVAFSSNNPSRPLD